MKKRLLPLLLLGGSVCAQDSSSQSSTSAATGISLQMPALVSSLPSSSSGYEPEDLSTLDQYAPFPAQGVYWIQEGGGPKMKFILSMEEIAVGSKGAGNYQSYGPALNGVHALELAEELALITGKKVWPVLYPADVPPSRDSRRLMSDRVHVILEPGVDRMAIAAQIGAPTIERFEFAPDDCFFRFNDALSALRAAEQLKGIPGVVYIEPCLTKQYNPHALPLPSDNLYDASYNPTIKYEGHPDNEARTAYQWYLENTGLNYNPRPAGAPANVPLQLPRIQGSPPTNDYFHSWYALNADPANSFALVEQRLDIRARPAWEYTRGATSRINILDTAVHINHPDLTGAKDFSTTLFRDYVDDDDNVLPETDTVPPVWFGGDEFHGTGMAGIMLAQHNNGVSNPSSSPRELAGIAPLSKFIVQRVVGQLDEVDLVRAVITDGDILTRQSTVSGSGGSITYTELTFTGSPSFDVLLYAISSGGSAPQPLRTARLIMEAFEWTLTKPRNRKSGKGPVIVTAALNNGNFHGNQNWGELRASGMALVVGGVSDSGSRIAYVSRGANLSVVAPAAGTEDTVRDEMIPSMEPRIDPSPSTPWPRTIPGFINYPAVPSTPMPFTIANLPQAEIDYQWDSAHTTQRRRAGQTIVTLNAESKATPLYWKNSEGSSAASAMVAGIASLICSVRPDLNWLDIHEIIMRSSDVNMAPVWWNAYSKETDLTKGVEDAWMPTPTGKPFSHKFGYGVVNAERAVEWAKSWIPLASPVIKEGTNPIEPWPPRSKGVTTVTDPQTGKMIVWDRFPQFTSQNLTNSNIPRSLFPIPVGLRIQRIILGFNAPNVTTPVAVPVSRDNMGIRLIAPPENDPVPGVAPDPTIISHLMYPAQEDIGRGVNYWKFSTNHHLGGVYKTSKNLLLHVYGSGAASGKYGSNDGVEVSYLGTRESNPVNEPPGFRGNALTGNIRAPIGQALCPTSGGIYFQAAPIGTPPRWTRFDSTRNTNEINIWFGGLVPADATNPADPDTPGMRRVRSPHVMKPFPLPLVPGLLDASYPAPLDVPESKGFVPLDLPQWRTVETTGFGPWQVGLPPGVLFDPVSGIFSGVPTQIGRFQIEITATNMFDFAPAPAIGLGLLLIKPGKKLLIDVEFYTPGDFVTYTEWSKRFFPGVDPSVPADEDPDEDGFSNYFEFIAGSFPESYQDPALVEALTPYYVEFERDVTPARIHLHWTQNRDSERKFFVETSTDLVNWARLVRPVPTCLDTADSYDFYHTVVPGERRYFRLKDSVP